MASPEIRNQSSLFLSEIYKFPSHIVALYNSDDFQTRVCWWLIYILAILMVLIHLGWKLYGPEISKTFKLQGGQNTPTRQRSQDGLSSKKYDKKHID